MEQIVKPCILTAKELMELDFPPPEWLIEGLLPEGLTVLSGAPKIGKSWLSLQLALAVTTGRPIFGWAPASKKVFFFSHWKTTKGVSKRVSPNVE